MFFGSIPALVTPFSAGRVAEDTFAGLVEWQIAEGSNGLVPEPSFQCATHLPERLAVVGCFDGKGHVVVTDNRVDLTEFHREIQRLRVVSIAR